jgi:peptidyl-prolyl cis-trans isomerase SurA
MNRRFPEIYFEKDKADFTPDAQKMLYELAVIMIKNRDYTVEITGNSDADEPENISAERARNIVNSLINKGISATRLLRKMMVNLNQLQKMTIVKICECLSSSSQRRWMMW